MTKFTFLVCGLMSLKIWAFESEMVFTGPELKENQLVVKAIVGDDNNLSVAASRVLQLQLNASGCHRTIITPNTMKAAIQYKFTASADNCKIAKKSEACDDGLNPKDILANPHAPDYTIIGAEKYKVCLQGPSQTKKTEAPEPPAAAKPHSDRDPARLLKYFTK